MLRSICAEPETSRVVASTYDFAYEIPYDIAHRNVLAVSKVEHFDLSWQVQNIYRMHLDTL